MTAQVLLVCGRAFSPSGPNQHRNLRCWGLPYCSAGVSTSALLASAPVMSLHLPDPHPNHHLPGPALASQPNYHLMGPKYQLTAP